MSRTNHYRICDKCSPDSFCWIHERPWSTYIHKPIREIAGRRPWKRRDRYGKHTPKSFHNPPPRWWWQEQHAKYRQVCRSLMAHDDDPALPPERKVIDLWGWY